MRFYKLDYFIGFIIFIVLIFLAIPNKNATNPNKPIYLRDIQYSLSFLIEDFILKNKKIPSNLNEILLYSKKSKNKSNSSEYETIYREFGYGIQDSRAKRYFNDYLYFKKVDEKKINNQISPLEVNEKVTICFFTEKKGSEINYFIYAVNKNNNLIASTANPILQGQVYL